MKLHTRKNKYLLSGHHGFFYSRFFILLVVVLAISVLVFSFFAIRRLHTFLPSVPSLYTDWKAQNYESVYKKSALILEKHPLAGTILALHGFSAYYLFTAQNDPTAAQSYLIESINSLRNAWYRISATEKPRLAYVLGKAYYQRGYFYADLAMKYLDFAYISGIHFDDLAEFRGLSASLLGDYNTSISSFTEALSVKPSDLLLFTLAQDYLQIKNTDKAKEYLAETIRTSKDELLQLKCHYVLGTIFLQEQKITEAHTEFDTILEKDPNNADAHYGLGVIYETQGDLIRARSEWRKAIRLNPVHPGARAKLNL
jgi:tetratricopeptide (TPR) repeat protein